LVPGDCRPDAAERFRVPGAEAKHVRMEKSKYLGSRMVLSISGYLHAALQSARWGMLPM